MSRLRRWLSSTVWAIADQAFVSSSGFVLNVLGGRWLGAAEYGAYSLVLSLYLIVFVTHYAVLVEPMLLLAGSEFEQRQQAYQRLSGYEHAAAIIASSLFWTGVLATTPDRLGRLFYGAGFDLPLGARWPLALLPTLLGVAAISRALCLARMQLATPLFASASAALVALTLGIWALRRDEVSGALWGMAIAVLAQALVLLHGLRTSARRYATPQ